MTGKDKFLEIFNQNIHRKGAKELLDYIIHSDFFLAPASTRFHGAYEGGLLDHSLNVYYALNSYLHQERVLEYSMQYTPETVAIVALLHDLCKIDFYETDFRNQKINGVWERVPYYKIVNKLPYGHGEKSVYILSDYMKLTNEEAFAIRYHMGFSGCENPQSIGAAFEQYPLAFALSTADMEATYFLDKKV